MMLALMVAGAVVVMTVLLALAWRREGRRHGGVPARLPALVVALLVSLAGAGFYLWLGHDEATGEWLADQQRLAPVAREIINGRSPTQLSEDIRIGPLARVLQRELARRPDSATGWYALGELYEQMEAPQMTVQAARKGLEVASDAQRTDLEMLLARGLVGAARGQLVPEAEERLRGILEKHPTHDGAWTVLAMAASQSGRHELAIEAFESLLSRHGDGRIGDMLRRGLEQARAADRRQGELDELTVTVNAPEGMEPGGTLFVFLRRPDGTGQPLAARRLLAREFPLNVTLRPEDWLQPFPGDDAALMAGARYSPAPGGGVEQAGSRAEPVPVDTGATDGPAARLELAR